MSNKKRMPYICSLFLLAAGLGAGFLYADQKENKAIPDGKLEISSPSKPFLRTKHTVTPKMREEAAQRKAAQNGVKGEKVEAKIPRPSPGGQPNYFGPEPNYANSSLPIIKKGVVVAESGIRKFIDSLPGLGHSNRNNLGQYIPVAVPDTKTFSGSDYYELGVVQYEEQMHSDLPKKARLRGYVQLNTDSHSHHPSQAAHYLGPMIIAHKERPVRVKMSNLLPTGPDGNLFLPVDTSVMGAGVGPDMINMYTQNRAELHLHGGATPWISDGTPHQWVVPAGENTPYVRGVSFQPVPDMPIPVLGDGTATYYYPNQQSSRLMFIHDHSYGITRLNVYAGEVLPYLLTDDREEKMIEDKILPSLGGVYTYGIPLIIQDKTFIPPREQLLAQDPTWNYLKSVGRLWFPHVYMPNQNTNDECGCNDMGRWDYGPWFWPPFNAGAGLIHGPILDPNGSGLLVPGTPNPSIVPEAFMDTPVVNGTAYPYLDVDRKPYRFRILNGCNDRYLNLQLYYAEPLSVSITHGGSGYTEAPKVVFKGDASKSAKGVAIIADGHVTGVTVTDPGEGYTVAPIITFSGGGKHAKGAKAIASLNTEVKMVPASADQNFPSYYPTPDDRAGGFPDPAMSGPSMIQIGTEGGFLPKPVVLPNTPIGYQYNRRDITVLNVLEKTLFMGPAERADVIIDFSQVPDDVSYVIFYNDAPAPVPSFDPRNDYYTNGPDLTSTGGAPSTIAGYGPNTRTILQFRLSKKKGKSFDLATLNHELPKAFAATQPAPLVPEHTYPAPYKASANTYARIQDTTLSFTPFGATAPLTHVLVPKAIIESFDTSYGRMNALLGAELPFTNDGTQTSVPLQYRDPPTENLTNYQTQLWKITHNGVDTHAIHFHLFNVQVVNRVGWDGMIKPPDANELGWKETVRMNPLEDVIIALRPVLPSVPFAVPNSVRLLDPTMMEGMTWQSFDPLTGAGATITNTRINYGWEYVWHCHLLGHEENDMMRPMTVQTVPSEPTNVVATPGLAAGTAIVSFSSSAFLGTVGPIASYTVTAIPTVPQGLLPVTDASSPITVTGLQSGTAYTFTVTATGTSLDPNQPVTSTYSLVSNSIIAP